MARPRSSIKRAAPARTSSLLCLLLASSRICHAFTNDFTSYPSGSQACLDQAATASKCDGQTSQDMNRCLCSNRGDFIYASARCIARASRDDLTIVYETMENNCAGTQTWISVGKPAWDATAEQALSDPEPTTTAAATTTTTAATATSTTTTATTAAATTTTAAATTTTAGAPTGTGEPSILDEMPTGTKVGLFVGVVFGALALVLASIFLWLYGRRRRRDHGPYGQYGGKSPDPSEIPPGFHHQQLQSETELSSMYYKPALHAGQPSPLGGGGGTHPAGGYWEPQQQQQKQQQQQYAAAPPYAHHQQQQPFIAELDDGTSVVHELPGESAKRHYAELPDQPPPASLPQSPTTAVPQSPFPPSPYTSTFGSHMDGGTNISLDSRYR